MKNQLKRGFTLIEVVIVLAIAALIMVVVFLAVQGAQRSQRDQARKDTANRVLAAATSYRGNNNGSAPANAAALASYLNWSSASQSVNGVTITLTANATAPTASGCTSSTGTIAITSSNPTTVATCLESASTNYVVND